MPVIHDAVPYADIFSSSNRAACLKNGIGFVFWEDGGVPLHGRGGDAQVSQALTIAVGPEGGFTGEEIARAEAGGFSAVTLGKRILRAETAAIAATALVQFLFGDLGGRASSMETERGKPIE